MPEAMSIGPFLVSVPVLGLVLGYFLTIWVLSRYAPRCGMDSPWIVRTVEFCAVGGIIAARIGFVAINWESYWDDPLPVLFFWQPGYSLGVGIVVALMIAAWRIHRKRGLWHKQSILVLVGGSATTVVAFYLVAGIALLTVDRDAVRSGTTIADFVLQDLNGDTVRWSDLKGEVVLLNFWATWCPPCRREMPLLNAVNEAYGAQGFKVVGVAVGEPERTVRAYADSIGVTYPIWLNGDAVGQDRTQEIFAINGGVGLPTTLFVDRAGVIRKRYVGELSRGFIDSEIKSLLF